MKVFKLAAIVPFLIFVNTYVMETGQGFMVDRPHDENGLMFSSQWSKLFPVLETRHVGLPGATGSYRYASLPLSRSEIDSIEGWLSSSDYHSVFSAIEKHSNLEGLCKVFESKFARLNHPLTHLLMQALVKHSGGDSFEAKSRIFERDYMYMAKWLKLYSYINASREERDALGDSIDSILPQREVSSLFNVSDKQVFYIGALFHSWFAATAESGTFSREPSRLARFVGDLCEQGYDPLWKSILRDCNVDANFQWYKFAYPISSAYGCDVSRKSRLKILDYMCTLGVVVSGCSDMLRSAVTTCDEDMVRSLLRLGAKPATIVRLAFSLCPDEYEVAAYLEISAAAAARRRMSREVLGDPHVIVYDRDPKVDNICKLLVDEIARKSRILYQDCKMTLKMDPVLNVRARRLYPEWWSESGAGDEGSVAGGEHSELLTEQVAGLPGRHVSCVPKSGCCSVM